MAITTKQLAQRAGVTNRRIRQLCAQGIIQAEKTGRDWLVPDEEAERWLREREGERKRSTSD